MEQRKLSLELAKVRRRPPEAAKTGIKKGSQKVVNALRERLRQQ